ncbi:MAG: response regulator [Oligoflexales bacterium]
MSTAARSKTGRIVLIDDDRSFGYVMQHYASKFQIELDYYASLEELGFVALLGNYDVAIVDYDLGAMNGVEIGNYLGAFFNRMPMLLISGTTRTDENIMDGGVRQFMHKKLGPERILSAAVDMRSEAGGLNPMGALRRRTKRNEVLRPRNGIG